MGFLDKIFGKEAEEMDFSDSQPQEGIKETAEKYTGNPEATPEEVKEALDKKEMPEEQEEAPVEEEKAEWHDDL